MDSVGTPIVGGESFSTKPRGTQGKRIHTPLNHCIWKEKQTHYLPSGAILGAHVRSPNFPHSQGTPAIPYRGQFRAQADTSPPAVKGI